MHALWSIVVVKGPQAHDPHLSCRIHTCSLPFTAASNNTHTSCATCHLIQRGTHKRSD